jgi:hypothetical protein
MKKPDPEYTVPRVVWIDAVARCDELVRAARSGKLPMVIRYQNRMVIRRAT